MATAVPGNTNRINGSTMLKLRKKLDLNQGQFWSKVKVTQSGGSRYESGREIPQPTRIAIAFVYQDEIKKFARAIA